MPVESGLKLKQLKALLKSSVFGLGGLQTLNFLPLFPADVIDRFWKALRPDAKRSPEPFNWADRVRVMLVAAATGESIPGKMRGEPLERQIWINRNGEKPDKHSWKERFETLMILNSKWLDVTLVELVRLLNIRAIYIRDYGFTSTSNDALNALVPLSALRHLELTNCWQLSDLRPLSELCDLRTLFLNACGNISNLGPLASLAELEHLTIYRCQLINDLRPLANLRKLKTLSFSECIGITDVSPLAGLTGLDLRACCDVRDLLPLINRTSIRS